MCSQQLRKMADSAFPRVASGSEPEITGSYVAIDTLFTWLIFTHTHIYIDVFKLAARRRVHVSNSLRGGKEPQGEDSFQHIGPPCFAVLDIRGKEF